MLILKHPAYPLATHLRLSHLLAAIAILVFAPFLSLAQSAEGPEGSGGWEMGAPYSKLYDPTTLETIEGRVVRIEKMIPRSGMSYGVQLLVKTGRKTVLVHLGPSWYIDNQDFAIEPKDKIVVTGSRVKNNKKEVVIANEVTIGSRMITLRNEQGYPVWSGWIKN